MMEKKYFLTDTEIKTSDDDFFRHEDIANNMHRILLNNKPPYNIAVIGKWGLGKSSLINMLKRKVENNSEYTVVEINAWKYEKEALAKVFLRQVVQQLDTREHKRTQTVQDRIKKTLSDVLEQIKKVHVPKEIKIFDSLKKVIKDNWLFLLLYVFSSFVIFALYKLVALWCEGTVVGKEGNDSISLALYWGKVFTGYCKNVVTLIFVPIVLGISTQIMGDIRSKESEKFEFRLPKIGVEDYEIELENKIKEKQLDENHRVIIILDDMDRLSVSKMMEALDAIKIFINYPNCVFIVPFDDSILKKAIEKSRLKDMNGTNVALESEMFLDKLFQYKFYLAPLLKYDIKKYAVDLCVAEMPDFINEYCDKKLFTQAIRNVLIHSEVNTPRQVKKLVNSFVSNLMIARSRENGGKTEPDFSRKEKNILMLAKISVLQADFNEFYDLLFIEPDAMKIVLEANKDGEAFKKLPRELKVYFSIGANENSFRKEHQPLINFLTRTKKYSVEPIESFLYIATDEISLKTGGKKQQEFLKAITSGNITETRKLLEENPEYIVAATYFLNDSDDMDEIRNVFNCALDVVDLLESKAKIELFNAIAERADEISTDWGLVDEEQIAYDNLIEGYLQCENKLEYEKVINACINSDYEEKAKEKLTAYTGVVEKLGDTTVVGLQEHISWLLENDLIEMQDFIAIKKDYKHSCEEWMEIYYNYLVRNMNDNKNYASEVSDEVVKSFEKIAKKENVSSLFNTVQQLSHISSLTNMFIQMLSLPVCDNIKQEQIDEIMYAQVYEHYQNDAQVNSLLLLRNYEVSEDDISIFDGYFGEQVGKQIFGKLICGFVQMNDMEGLVDSVKAFTNWLFESEDKYTTSTYSEIISILTDAQRENIVKRWEEEAAYATNKNYIEIGGILQIHSEEYWDDVKDIVSAMLTRLSNSVITESYILFASDCIYRVFDKITKEEKDTYLNSLSDKVSDARYNSACIYALCKISNQISDEDFLGIEPKLSKGLETDNCKEIFTAMRKHKSVFSNKDGSISNYVNVCLMTLQECNIANEVLEELDWFNYIGKVPELFDILLEISDRSILDKGHKLIVKYLNNKKIENAVKNILVMLEAHSENEDFLDILRDYKKNDSENKIVDELCDISKKYQIYDLLNYIRFLIMERNLSDNESIYRMVDVLANLCEGGDEYQKLIAMLEEMKKEQFRGFSKKYVKPIVHILDSTASDALIERLVMISTSLRISPSVKAQVNPNTAKRIKSNEKK